MARNNRNDKLSSKLKVHIDKELDFASIKILDGVEAKSYTKDGLLVSEDKHGNILEIQILNLSLLKKFSKGKRAA